ncbi:MAG TPA: DMT family transporter [Acetobacteraceae bacterium]
MFTSAESAPRHRLIGTRAEGLALLVTTATIWGCTWPQNKYLLSLLPPFTARAIPNMLGAGFAFAVALASRQHLRPPRGEWRWLLIYGVLNYGAFTVFTTLSLVWLNASQAVVITYTLPVWASLLAWPMLGERPTPRRLLAIVLALGGVALLVGSGSMQADLTKLPGVLSGFAAAVLFGLGTVVAKKRPLAMPPVTGVAWQGLFGALLVLVLALFEHPHWNRLNAAGIAIFCWIAVMPLTVAYLAWFRALRFVPASLAATTVLLSPTIGVVASALVLGDPFGPRQVVALVLTLTGVALAALK